MTLDEIIREARRLDEAATKGPWEAQRQNVCSPAQNGMGLAFWSETYSSGAGGSYHITFEEAKANAAFAAFARTALPRLARVAAAAVKMRSYLATPKAGTGRAELDAIRAFDAAVHGDRLPQPDEQEGAE